MVFVAPWWICSAPPHNENLSLRSRIESLVGRWGTRKVAHRIEPLGQAEIANQGSPRPSSRAVFVVAHFMDRQDVGMIDVLRPLAFRGGSA